MNAAVKLLMVLCCIAPLPLGWGAFAQESGGSASPSFEARALVQSVAELVLSSEVKGRLEKVPFREGEAFAQGDTLIRFDCRAYEAGLKVAKAQLKAVRLTLDTVRKRAELDSVGPYEVGIAEAEYEKAKGEADGAQFPVERCHIRAPFDGRIVELAAHEHEAVSVDQPIMSIIDDKRLELKIVVPSSWLSWLDINAPFTLLVDETGTVIPGRVARVGALVDAVGQSVPLYGELEDITAKLMAGMSGTVTFQRP
ncbi:efflux RND transporter periplasmic adaptor subunit [Magnetovibrio sp. PR-2]|uniref:efflux RND transporter periplasmic adaptor subunit n=1 Tax=Magnetovibrio sp. PR-2 TaxID=3120356 RepID=UPI002FCE1E39